MQCGELMYRKVTIMTQGNDSVDNRQKKPEKETIHSGHFMVSHFEAEAQDDEYDVAIPLPEEETKFSVVPSSAFTSQNYSDKTTQHVSIETNLTKLFQCMSLAYRQKLTSPKWNRFKGIRLRWKDKIRLNNVIWRCWHMQFIMKQNTMVCQFASPLDVDTHNKPEAVVLEGKYWKRKLAAVTAEYKKWRMFYRNRIMGWNSKDGSDVLQDMDMFDWQPHSNDSADMGSMMVDEDYMEFMSDTLFSTIQSQPFAFPDTREIARGASLADFIQPSLVQLQPNLDDFMDTLEPLHDLVNLSHNVKLPSVPEECVVDDCYRSSHQGSQLHQQQQQQQQQQPQLPVVQPKQEHQPQQTQTPNLQYTATIYAQPDLVTGYTTPANSNLVARTDGFQQGHVSYGETPLAQVASTPASTVTVPTVDRRMVHPVQSSRIVPQVQQQQHRSLYQQHQQATSPYQNVSPASLSPPSVQQQPPPHSSQMQAAQFAAQQPTFRASPPQVQVYSVDALNVVDPEPANASPPLKPTIRSNSLSGTEEDMFAVPKYNRPKQRIRSRSELSLVPGSSSGGGQRQHPPPLVSAASDPSLPTINSSSLQPLLAHLLSNNSTSGVFNFTGSDRYKGSQVVPILPMPPQSSPSVPQTTTALLITTPVTMTQVQGSLSSPGSPHNTNQEHRRECHTKAEHKRRCNIKNGFDMLHSLIPQLHQNPTAKLSKAAMLQKGAEYIQQLRAERDQLRDEMHSLKQEIECLNASISNCQSMLPATGAPVSRQRASKMREMFDEYVRIRTRENWKFWIFSILFEPLLTSYNSSVSTASLDDLYRSTLHWVEQHCSLVDLRPAVLNSLRYLSTATEILTDPSKLPEEARQAVLKDDRH
ncbi:MLX-interacting protein [Anabrus simplex]|uniref:MLX-interacting protein n=1 Tax=Anabrus simplex TaxID=316456 RepID=UPI0035A32441